MSEELDQAKDQLIDDVEAFLMELLGCNTADAEARGVGKDLRNDPNESGTDIEELLIRIAHLRHREFITATLQAAKAGGKS